MSSTETRFKIYRGDTKKWRWEFPYDITGVQVDFTLKKCTDDLDLDAVVQFSTIAGSDTNDDVVNGVMYITLPSDVSATLSPAEYYFGFQKTVTGTPPEITTLLVGILEVEADILQG